MRGVLQRHPHILVAHLDLLPCVTWLKLLVITVPPPKTINVNGKHGTSIAVPKVSFAQATVSSVLPAERNVPMPLDLVCTSVPRMTMGRWKRGSSLPRLSSNCKCCPKITRAVSSLFFGRFWSSRYILSTLTLSGKYCLDVRHDSPAYNGKNWTSLKDVQLWTCSADVKDNNMVSHTVSLRGKCQLTFAVLDDHGRRRAIQRFHPSR